MTESHGTRASYKAGCGCVSCRSANAGYQSEYRRLKAEGKTPLRALVSARDVARTIYEMTCEGYSRGQIAHALGLKRPILEFHTGEGARIQLANYLRLKRLHRLWLSEGPDDPLKPSVVATPMKTIAQVTKSA